MRYLISGGGTGGHIFPAVSIANALKQLDPQAEILFVGALGRMEMERVPQAGYQIIGLPVRGFNRAQPWKNFSVLWDLLRSIIQVRKIIRDFKPQVGVGVGGYASGVAMWAAANKVIMPLGNMAPMLCNRNLLYTAVTRAKTRVILVGRESIVEAMTKNEHQTLRYTGLYHRLKSV